MNACMCFCMPEHWAAVDLAHPWQQHALLSFRDGSEGIWHVRKNMPVLIVNCGGTENGPVMVRCGSRENGMARYIQVLDTPDDEVKSLKNINAQRAYAERYAHA